MTKEVVTDELWMIMVLTAPDAHARNRVEKSFFDSDFCIDARKLDLRDFTSEVSAKTIIIRLIII